MTSLLSRFAFAALNEAAQCLISVLSFVKSNYFKSSLFAVAVFPSKLIANSLFRIKHNVTSFIHSIKEKAPPEVHPTELKSILKG